MQTTKEFEAWWSKNCGPIPKKPFIFDKDYTVKLEKYNWVIKFYKIAHKAWKDGRDLLTKQLRLDPDNC